MNDRTFTTSSKAFEPHLDWKLVKFGAEKGLCGEWPPRHPAQSLSYLGWLKPVTPTQQLLADQARLKRAQASNKGQPAKQKNPVGLPPGNSSVGVTCMGSSVFSTV
eukprot:1152060-Pelagomonas_calceolata.AAC.3